MNQKEEKMKEFDELLQVATTLIGPGGCPWDAKQTFFSLQPYVLEEAHELVEAVDGQDDEEIVEELGDLLYTVIFYCKLAEKENRFTVKEVIEALREKLVRRHPHVFACLAVKDEEEVVQNWERIKKEEKGKKERKSKLEGIPDQLPSLAKGQKMHKVFTRAGFLADIEAKTEEEKISRALWDLIQRAEEGQIDIEGAFRRQLSAYKHAFMSWEGG